MATVKWRPLLGDDLAKRVAKVAGDDPAGFCRAAVEAAVNARTSTPAATVSVTPAQAKCPHPEKDRLYSRCRACGLRGLPNVTKGKSDG